MIISKMLWLSEPRYKNDECRLIIRAHTFFKIVQADWIAKTRTNHKTLEITDLNEQNLQTGGECSVFDIMQELKNAVWGESYCEQVMLAIKPDCLNKKVSS